jgi:hypothetical protein
VSESATSRTAKWTLSHSPVRVRAIAIAGIAASLTIRGILIRAFPGDFDSESYTMIAGIVERGGVVYRETDRYNYSPLWSFILVGTDRASRAMGVPLEAGVGILLSAVDLLTAAVLYRILRLRGSRWPEIPAVLFFLNPVSILMSCYHGQFDNLALLFLLLALLAVERRPASDGTALVWLSLSLLAKHVAWFHPLAFAARRPPRRALVYLAPYAVFFGSFLPYAAAAPDILRNVFGHQGLHGYYGTEFLFFVPGVPESFVLLTALFALASLAAVIGFRHLELGRACLLLFLVGLIFLPGFQPHFCVWPIALGCLYGGAGLLVYVVIASGFLIRIMFGAGAAVPLLPGWFGPWWGAIFWLLWELRKLSRARVPVAGRV